MLAQRNSISWRNGWRVGLACSLSKMVCFYGDMRGWDLSNISLVLLAPFQLYPIVGIVVSAWFRALGTAQTLHKRVSNLDESAFILTSPHTIKYFESKRMTEQQIAIFVEERKWDYRSKKINSLLIWALTRKESLWIYSSPTRRASYHRFVFHGFQSHRCSDVGLWCVVALIDFQMKWLNLSRFREEAAFCRRGTTWTEERLILT